MACSVTWVLETEVFADKHAALTEAVRGASHRVVQWRDDWSNNASWPALEEDAVVFHGSLSNAQLVHERCRSWRPGSFGDLGHFSCMAWYGRAREWLLHDRWVHTTVEELVADAQTVVGSLGDQVFVRPDSSLKPFSGRVLPVDQITLAALDHGFYYDDKSLPIVVAPVRQIQREWRYVVAGGVVIAGSAYAADGREALSDDPSGDPWKFAASIASRLFMPPDVYVMDICEARGSLWLLELNPFSGADLYACDVGRTGQSDAGRDAG